MAKKDLRISLNNSLLIGDGAMATQLYALGVPVGICYQELSLTNPSFIRSVHEAYIKAGATLIETNTFGATREALTRYGLEHKVVSMNRAATVIAHEAAGEDVFVVGSIGSVIAGRVRNSDWGYYRDQFEEQASALLRGNVDGIMLETFMDLEELLVAIEVVNKLTDLPIIAQLATPEVGRTRDGYTVTSAFQSIKNAGAFGVGLNCRLGPAEMLRTLENSIVPESTPLAVFANAGRLGLSEDGYAFKSSPEYFAESALRLRGQGVSLIGGCCGTTPAHIKAMAQALAGLSPLPRENAVAKAVVSEEVSKFVQDKKREKGIVDPEIRLRGRSELDCPGAYRLEQRETIVDLVEKRPTVIVEFDPPKNLETEKFFRGAYELTKAGAAAITIADNSLANVRMSNMALGAILKERYGIEPLLHIACRDRNLIGQQSHLMGLHALGIEQVLVITGDPSRYGDLPGASSVFDTASFDLIRLVKELNSGISFAGHPLEQKANFMVGAAFNPYVKRFEAAIERLKRKEEAGADYIMTQPLYSMEMLEKVHEAAKNINIPVFAGIMPLTSGRNAEYLHNEVPGITLTQEALERMHGLKGEIARQEGLSIAKELIDEAVKYFNGIYLITPFDYYEMTVELAEYVKRLP